MDFDEFNEMYNKFFIRFILGSIFAMTILIELYIFSNIFYEEFIIFINIFVVASFVFLFNKIIQFLSVINERVIIKKELRRKKLIEDLTKQIKLNNKKK